MVNTWPLACRGQRGSREEGMGTHHAAVLLDLPLAKLGGLLRHRVQLQPAGQPSPESQTVAGEDAASPLDSGVCTWRCVCSCTCSQRSLPLLGIAAAGLSGFQMPTADPCAPDSLQAPQIGRVLGVVVVHGALFDAVHGLAHMRLRVSRSASALRPKPTWAGSGYIPTPTRTGRRGCNASVVT